MASCVWLWRLPVQGAYGQVEANLQAHPPTYDQVGVRIFKQECACV